jgi:hypothetical protein
MFVLVRVKERMLKAVREKGQEHIKAGLSELHQNFHQRLKARRAWADVIQTLREYKCQPRLLYLAKLSITIDGETKYSTTKPNSHIIFPQNQPFKG